MSTAMAMSGSMTGTVGSFMASASHEHYETDDK
jgi:hypothetical protein